MSIDRAGRWWKGTTAEDLAEYLRELTADGYPADTIRASTCASCGGTVFGLRGDRDEGSVMRLCRRCGTEAFIADSEDTWANATPRWCKCPCGSDDFAVAVGFSLREGGDVRWVTVGNRCAKCGILGSFADWRVNYGPSDHLIVMA